MAMKITKIVLTLIVLALAAFAAIRPLGFYSTLGGMQSVVRGDPGTFAWTNNNLIVMAWQQGSGYAFTVSTATGDVLADLKKFVNGNNTTWKTFIDFSKWLEAQGYRAIGPSEIPMQISMTINSYSLLMVATGARALPNLMILPIFPDLLTTPTWSPQ
jgi:hypothetical protein